MEWALIIVGCAVCFYLGMEFADWQTLRTAKKEGGVWLENNRLEITAVAHDSNKDN